jgi:hypothetical protein
MSTVRFLNRTITSLAVMSMLTFSVSAISAESEKKNLHEQAEELKLSGEGNTVFTTDMLDDVLKTNGVRDKYREDEGMSILKKGVVKSEIELVEAEKELIIAEFIKKNVPAEILASGEKAVASYISDNFVREKNNNGPEKTIIWHSTTNAISTPTLTTTTVVTKPLHIEKNNIQNPSAIEGEVLSTVEAEALSQLGITEAELALMLNGELTAETNKSVTPIKQPTKEPAYVKTNVAIGDIKVGRVVIMGKSHFADLRMSLNILNGSGQRQATRNFEKIGVGYIFSVEDISFELINLDSKQMVFENLETRKTFRKLID